MTATTTPTAVEIADLCDKAADVITANGHQKRHLYDDTQAAGGTPLSQCRVDVFGALNIADHGWPLYCGRPLVAAAEKAVQAHLGALSLPIWNDSPKRTTDNVIHALRDTATSLREAVTA